MSTPLERYLLCRIISRFSPRFIPSSETSDKRNNGVWLPPLPPLLFELLLSLVELLVVSAFGSVDRLKVTLRTDALAPVLLPVFFSYVQDIRCFPFDIWVVRWLVVREFDVMDLMMTPSTE